MIRPCSLAKSSLSFCVSSGKGVYAVRVCSVAHGMDDFLTVPSRFLERNNSLVGLLDFIVQSSQRLVGVAGYYVVENISNSSYARLLSGDGRDVKYFYHCSLKKIEHK